MLTILMAKRTEDFGTLLLDIQRNWRSVIDRRLRPLGLTQAKWRALLHIAKAHGALNQTDLAESIGIETPSLAKLLDRLQKDGWVMRCDCPEDKRVKFVKLTPKAGDAMKIIEKTANDTRRELLIDISGGDMQTLTVILSRIRKKAELMSDESPHR